MSTTGDSPVTVTVSSSAPTLSSALIVAVNSAASCSPSRLKLLKPGQAEGERVGARPQIEEAVQPLVVGDRGPDPFDERLAGGLDGDAREHPSRGVPDHAVDGALRQRGDGHGDQQALRRCQHPEQLSPSVPPGRGGGSGEQRRAGPDFAELEGPKPTPKWADVKGCHGSLRMSSRRQWSVRARSSPAAARPGGRSRDCGRRRRSRAAGGAPSSNCAIAWSSRPSEPSAMPRLLCAST